jgi:uncharacterized RDD family membrane protein YckC
MVEACPNHPHSPLPLQRCVQCGGSFCPDCLVSFRGGLYDAACKEAQLRDRAAQTALRGPRTFWRRAGAAVVDGVVVYVVYNLLWRVSLRVFHLRELLAGASVWTFGLASWGTLSLVVMLHDGLLVSRNHGATFGKRFFKLRVVDRSGSPVSAARGWARASIKGLFFLTPIPLFVDALPLGFAPRRAIHDWLAGTRVVDARSVAKEQG